MSTHQSKRQQDSRPVDASKYNLRCNRNVSEKMSKKDFIYDIRPTTQTPRKPEDAKSAVVLPIQLRRKQSSDPKTPQYTVISETGNVDGAGDAVNVSEQRALGFECNFCHEPIATLLSLSTHVKLHCRRYCKTCYWVLGDDETMEQHAERSHRIRPGIITNL